MFSECANDFRTVRKVFEMEMCRAKMYDLTRGPALIVRRVISSIRVMKRVNIDGGKSLAKMILVNRERIVELDDYNFYFYK